MEIEKLNFLIIEGKLEEALNGAGEHFPEMKNETILLLTSYNAIEKDWNNGLMTKEEYGVKKSKISQSIIQLLNPQDKIDLLTDKTNVLSGMKRMIVQQVSFFKETISGFTNSKKILWSVLVFILIVGGTSIYYVSDLFPEKLGRFILGLTLVSFLTMIIGSLGFIIMQIKIFDMQQTFIQAEKE